VRPCGAPRLGRDGADAVRLVDAVARVQLVQVVLPAGPRHTACHIRRHHTRCASETGDTRSGCADSRRGPGAPPQSTLCLLEAMCAVLGLRAVNRFARLAAMQGTLAMQDGSWL